MRCKACGAIMRDVTRARFGMAIPAAAVAAGCGAGLGLAMVDAALAGSVLALAGGLGGVYLGRLQARSRVCSACAEGEPLDSQAEAELVARERADERERLRHELADEIIEERRPELSEKIIEERRPELERELRVRVEKELTPRIEAELRTRLVAELEPPLRTKVETEVQARLRSELDRMMRSLFSSAGGGPIVLPPPTPPRMRRKPPPPARAQDADLDPRERARRLARVIVSDLILYHVDPIETDGEDGGTKAVDAAWREAAAFYEVTVSQEVRRGTDYLTESIDAAIEQTVDEPELRLLEHLRALSTRAS